MNYAELRHLIACHVTDNLARQRICELLMALEEDARRRTRILKIVQEALSEVRLQVKYMEFDLEATRRERDALL